MTDLAVEREAMVDPQFGTSSNVSTPSASPRLRRAKYVVCRSCSPWACVCSLGAEAAIWDPSSAVTDELRSIVVEARPEPLALDPGKTAVIVVDMQNDFGAEGGMFARAGISIADIAAVVDPIAQVLDAARRTGMIVIYLTMQFEPDLSDAGARDAPNFLKHRPLGIGQVVAAPDGRESRTLVRGTWGTEILPELAPEEGDLVVAKHRYSGFFETELDAILRRRGIDSLVFTGCTTSVCVDSTLRDAFYRDYRCLLLRDCTGEPIGSDLARSNHEASLLVIETLFGWVSDSRALLRALQPDDAAAAVAVPRAESA